MLKAQYYPYKFHFITPGGTSRGVLTEKPSYFIKLWDDENYTIAGWGEVSLIPGLSSENEKDIEEQLSAFISNPDSFNDIKVLDPFPALKFGIETARFDLENGGNQILFPSDFTEGKAGIQINGLVWMGRKDEMLFRIDEKIRLGFTCIKLKIGAINFDDELQLLKHIRKSFSAGDLEIRVDANGAFNPDNALQKLEILSKFNLHSIEQPIKSGQWEKMQELCLKTALPIALDEELIGVLPGKKVDLLETIKPQFIILKPSLIGGLAETMKWSRLAEERNIGWWVTSALEGNIGLNAISQWTYLNGSDMPQGLGTGQVYSNNIDSPLEIKGEKLWYNQAKKWNIPLNK